MGHKIVVATSRIDPSQHETHVNEPVWWSVFRVQYVGLFNEEEAKEMLLTLSERSGQEFTEGECAFFIDVMGPFPFFLQWVGHEVFSRGFKGCTTAQRRQLLEELANDFTFFGLLESHYSGWLERLDEKQLALLLESASPRGITPSPAVASLKSKGLLVDDEAGRWHPFSRLFTEFLRTVPKGPILSSDAKARLWQGLLPAVKTVFEVAAKHYF